MESVKYIGLDVHQSTISVAVLNAEGKVMMQSVIATKATAVLDLLQGLRGVLHLSFEEGTYSAWLYDVVVRQVARVVVCNPRKNALLKSGNKSDQIDARKLAELLRAGMLSPVYHGEQSTRTFATTGSQLQRADRGHGPCDAADQSPISQSSDCLRGQETVRQAASRGMAGATEQQRAAAACGMALSGVGRGANLAAGSPASGDGGVPQESGREVAALHAILRSATRGGADCASADAAPLSHQASVLDLLRPGIGDAQQRRLCGEGWANPAAAQAGVHPRVELELQPRVEKCVQERRDDSERDGRSVPRLLRNASRQRNAAGHGAPDAGPQDGGHCPDSVEERRDVRSRTSEVTSSISAAHHREVRKRYPDVCRLQSCAHGFEGKYLGRDRQKSLMGHRMLPRTTQQSHSAAPDASLR